MKKIYLLLSFFFVSFMTQAQNPDAFIMTFEVTSSNLEIFIPIHPNDTDSYTVDFGDGTVLTNQTWYYVSHTYSGPGIYTVSITGGFDSIRYNYDTSVKTIEQWGTNQWGTMEEAFMGCVNLEINATDIPDLNMVTNMNGMFANVSNGLTQPFNINNWDVSNVTDMAYLFVNTNFNQSISNWDVSNVTDMSGMFADNSYFNQPIGNWNVSNVTNMNGMFEGATSFNQSINDWNVSNVTNMVGMFSDATSFNQPLNDWDVSNISFHNLMFANATSFNQPLNNWDVSNADTIKGMFLGAISFNQPLNDWDVSNVEFMSSMFKGASSFNQPLNNWDVSSVLNMSGMFYGATSFNQDISSWNFNTEVYLHNLTGSGFLSYSGLDTNNYDLLLLKLAQIGLQQKTLHAYDVRYCNSVVRNYLINQLNWTIVGDTIANNCMDNMISGNIIFDYNNNGCDENDVVINNFFVKGTDGTFTYSTTPNVEGAYNLEVFEGTYNVSLQNVPSYFIVNPISQIFTFEGLGNNETLDFCLTSTQTIQDLNIALLPVTEARPGFEAEYQLVVQNLGTQTVTSAQISLAFDNTKQTYVNANPAPASTTSNELNFEIASLPPFASSTINLTMETFTPPTVNGDDILNFTATLSPNTDDYTPNDNTFSLEQIVVNSFDPNDKQVLQGDKIHIDNVDEYLHYLIRFQNTGTASAINVRIEDELHESLDWNTIQIVGASHNYRVEITEGNQIEFIFQNINLPHEDADEAGSNGFIAYKIKAVEGLEIGDFIIGNEAEIYFDFNLPIITNPTSTEVVLPLPEIEPYGAITLDENNNGCDPEDTKSDFFFVQIDSETSNYSFSPEQGTYTLDFLEEATYTVSLQNVPDYFTVTPESYTLDYQGLGDYEALDFCVTANQIVEDVNIVVLPLNQAQAGSVNHYQIIVQNLGTQTIENLSLSLEFDPTQQTFVTSSPAASSVSSNQLNFTIASLSVLQSTVIDFSMQTFSTPTVNVGDILAFNVWVDSQNDTTSNDNAFVLKQTVTDSSQSNYKQVLQGDKILIEQATEYLHYFISFENTNTTIVANVKIEEYLHETLDWNTFQLLNASHNYQIGITQDNQIKFTFENISLAQGETGFLAYRIKPAHGLQVGDMIIGNEAEIYFDGVLSSITNAADTEIVNPTVGITPTVKHMLWVYPNPTSDVLNIQTKGNIQLEEVQLYNLQGRVLITSKQNLQSINLGGLSSGVYLLSIKTSEGNFSQRVIKK